MENPKLYDSVGNEVREGDIIRMKHYYSNRRWEYMYKQVAKYEPFLKRTKVYHLPIDDYTNENSYFYADQDLMVYCVVVATGKFDPERPRLKRSKDLRD